MHGGRAIVNRRLSVYIRREQMKVLPVPRQKDAPRFKRRRRVKDITVTAIEHRHKNGGPLHDLLLRACPPIEETKSIANLAAQIGVSAAGVHKWIRKGVIPPKRAKEIVEISAGRVTLADFDPFVYA